MQKLLRVVFLVIFLFNSTKKVSGQCNPVIFGEDTICAGSTSYLFVNDVYQSYSWSNGSTVSYTYATGPGTITLNTVDVNSCNGSANIVIRQVQPPSVSFNITPVSYTAVLSNTSTNTYAYQWYFGDGTSSTSVSPSHTYTTKGNYTICLNSAESYCPASSYCRSVAIGTSLGMPTDTTFLKVFNLELFNLNRIVQNPVDSGFLIAGQYDNCGECSSPMLIKTNKNGQVQWSRNFDYLYDISNLEYFDSGYVFLSSNSEFSLTKIDLNGNISWQKYDGIFGNKTLVVFSNTRMGLVINQDPLEVIIYDENGNIVTQKSYALGGWDMAFESFAKTSDGGVILNGQYGYNFPGPGGGGGGNHVLFDSYDQVAAKMDVNGNFLWMNGVYQNTFCSQNGQPVQNSAGEYLFPGRFYEPSASQYYYYISRFDGSGTYMNSFAIDSLKGDYSMFLSPSNNIVVVSRPQDPVYDSLRIVTMDNSFNILSSKKATAYNCSKSVKTYDGYIATAFTYFDNGTFLEYPALYKTNISANTACLDGNIPPITYASFPYVYPFAPGTTAPAYIESDTLAGCIAKNYDDSSLCRTCNVTASILVTGGDTLLCPGESVTLTAPGSMYEYVWNTGAHTRSITASAGGTYTVTVYDYRGCSATASKHLTAGISYNILYAITAPNGLCEGSSYSIHAYDSTFQSVYGITWNTGVSGPFVYPTSSGTFVSTFVDQYGCPTTDSVTVTLQPVPPVPNITGAVDVCDGDSAQLCATFVDNGSGPYTFSWNSGAFTDSCVSVPAGTYSVSITNRFGCDTAGTVTHTVTNNASPDPGLQPADSAFFCPGGNVLLSADAGFNSYQWSTGGTNSSITVNQPGVYSVTVDDGSGCTGTESVTVFSGINYNPVFSLDTTNGFCEGTSFIISVHDSLSRPVTSYSWSTGGTNSSITVSASNTYSVTLTDANGCTSSESFLVQMHPVAPNVTITGSHDVCSGSTVLLCASFTGNNSGPYSFSWNNGAFDDSCINAVGGSYTLVLGNRFGCTKTSTSFTVTSHAVPNPNIQPSGPIQICAGTDTTICATSGLGTYLWSNGATTNCIVVGGGNYNVTVTSSFGCVGTDAVTVTEGTALNPNIQPSGTILVCTGADTTLCAAAGFSNYSWSNGATANCITVGAGAYSVTVTDNSGCTGSDNVTIAETTPPDPAIQTGASVAICAGSDTTLCAAAGFASYNWSNGSTTNCINVSAGVYTVTVTDNSGCTGAGTVTVTEYTSPDPDIQPSGTVMVCSGSETVICAAAGFAAYQWSNGESTACISAGAGTFTLTVIDNSGCTGHDSVEVSEYAIPDPDIQPSGSIVICSGSDTLICATAGFANYLWSNGETTSCIAAGAGVISLTVTDIAGCTGSDSVTITEHIPPVPGIQPSGNILVCAGEDTAVCASAGFAAYSWSSGQTTNCITETSGTYIVVVTDNFGCTASDSVAITDRTPPDPNIQPSANFTMCSANDTTLCASTGFNSYTWSNGGTNNCITVYPGSYTVMVSDNFGCTGIDLINITGYQPPQPVILNDVAPFDTLFSSSATGNQWYESGVGAIAGAVQNYFVPDHNGYYYVIVTDQNGCPSPASDTTQFIYAFIPQSILQGDIKIYPNPAHDYIYVEFPANKSQNELVDISLYDVTGRKIFDYEYHILPQLKLDISTLAPAVYLLNIRGQEENFVVRIEKY